MEREGRGAIAAWLANRSVRRWIIFFVVVTGFSIGIVYSNVQTYDPKLTPATGYHDTIDYINMYFGRPATGIRAYRPLVPFLARQLPALPQGLFSSAHRFDPDVVAATKFGVVNFFFLIGACAAFLVVQQGFGLTFGQGFLGVLLFLGSTTVVRSAGLPMVDTAFFFFFLVCLIAIQRGNPWLFIAAGVLGVLAKELVLLSLPLILLTPFPRRRKIVLLAAGLPAIAAYVVVHVLVSRAAGGGLAGSLLISGVLDSLRQQTRQLLTPNGVINVGMSFGLVWIAAAYGLLRCDVPVLLRRWSLLLPLVAVGVILQSGNLGRSTFTAFPVLIPLGVIGLTSWVERSVSGHPAGRPA